MDASAQPVELPPVALRRPALGNGACLHQRLSLFGGLQAQLAARFTLAVERLRDGSRSANLAEQQNFDLELAGFVADAQPVADANLARRLGALPVPLNPAQVAGVGGERTGLEKSRGPEPFVNAHEPSLSPTFELRPDGLKIPFQTMAIINRQPLIAPRERVVNIADDFVTCALRLHVAFVAFAKHDHALAGVAAGSPHPVVLVPADGFGQPVLRTEEVDCAGFAVIVGE